MNDILQKKANKNITNKWFLFSKLKKKKRKYLPEHYKMSDEIQKQQSSSSPPPPQPPTAVSRGGVTRVIAKLETAIATGNYYEAHQMYRTLYFRYTSQKRYTDCLDLLYGGSHKLITKEQYTSAADLALLIVDTLEKQTIDNVACELWINRLSILISHISANVVERETLLVK